MMSNTMSAFDKITLRTRHGDTAEMVAYGAHVTSWRTANCVEQLYLSPRNAFSAGAAIRGGVPIIFPQFNLEGHLPRHGFARTVHWQPEIVDATHMAFVLRDDTHTRNIWPQAFNARYEIALGHNQLTLTLQIDNLGDAAMTFTSALHTYLQVGDIQQARIDGFSGVTYRDSAASGAMRIETDPQVRINGEVDRIYLSTPDVLTLHDGPQRQLQLHQTGFNDTVVWNPGADKCAALKDMPADDYQYMLCIEAARVGQPITLQPGQRWCGIQMLKLQE